MSNYKVPFQTRLQFAALFVLYEIVEGGLDFDTLTEDEETALTPILEWLFDKKYISMDPEGVIAVTPIGAETEASFRENYRFFLEEYDVFCAIDLNAGEFAFSYLENYSDKDESEWFQFLGDDRWDDLRIAVAEHEGKDPVEMVFMTYIYEGKFGRDDKGQWETEALTGSIWMGIEEICNSAIHIPSLGYEDEGVLVTGQEVIADIIAHGRKLANEMRV